MATHWYVMRDGSRLKSPLESNQLKEAAIRGHLKPTDMVQRQGDKAWYLAESIQGLFPPSLDLDETKNKQDASLEMNSSFQTKFGNSFQNGVGLTFGVVAALVFIYVVFLTETAGIFWKRTLAAAGLSFSKTFSEMMYAVPFLVIGAFGFLIYRLYSKKRG